MHYVPVELPVGGNELVVNITLPLVVVAAFGSLIRALWRDWLERRHAANGGTEGQQVARGVQTIVDHIPQIHRDHAALIGGQNVIIEGQKKINEAFDSNRMTAMYERGIEEGADRERRRRERGMN